MPPLPAEFPAGCGPPHKISVEIPAELLLIASLLGDGMPARGLRVALEIIATERAEYTRVLDGLRAYKTEHPEHDWEHLRSMDPVR